MVNGIFLNETSAPPHISIVQTQLTLIVNQIFLNRDLKNKFEKTLKSHTENKPNSLCAVQNDMPKTCYIIHDVISHTHDSRRACMGTMT